MFRLGNVEFKKPILISSGPLTSKLWMLKKGEEAGFAGASIKLTFREVPFETQMRSYSLPGQVILSPVDKRFGWEECVDLLKAAKKEVSFPLFANFSALGSDLDEWSDLATTFVEAGADALELNFCCPNLDVSKAGDMQESEHAGAIIGQDPGLCRRITAAVKSCVTVPVVCKYVPNALEPRAVAKACEQGGADGLHIVGEPISGLPPVDIYDKGRPLIPLMDTVAPGSTNGSICKYNTFMTVARARSVVSIPIIASGGIDTWQDCVQMVMWGANLLAVCSAPMWFGWQVVTRMNEGIEDYLAETGRENLQELVGLSLQYLTPPDEARLVEGHAQVDPDRCIGCGRCLRPAHCEAITWDETTVTDDREDLKAIVDAEKCIRCGICARLCPVGAVSYVRDEVPTPTDAVS